MSGRDRLHALVVAYDFPPHAAIGTMRTLRVVEALVEAQWTVTVLTSDPRTFRPGTAADDALLARVPAGVRVLRAPAVRGFDVLKGVVKRLAGPGRGASRPDAPAARTGAFARRPRGPVQVLVDRIDAALTIPDGEMAWLAPAVLRGLAACVWRRPDVLYASAPAWTGQLVAAALAFAFRRPWVADFRDPWARAPWREDRAPFAKRAAARLERMVVGRANRVVFVTEANRAAFAAQYGEAAARRFLVIPNGCDPREFEGPPPAPQAEGPFVLLHAGSLYAGRTPVPLLRALAAAIDDGRIDPSRFRLRFLGAVGLHGDDLPRTSRELGLESVVEFLPRVPREESVRAMRAASALLVLQPGHPVSVPGKLYEYLAAGRPVLAIANEHSETAALVLASGAGIAVPADKAAMARALACLVNRGEPSSQAPRAMFDGLARAREAVELLRTTAGRPVVTSRGAAGG